jgi:peptide deformylase
VSFQAFLPLVLYPDPSLRRTAAPVQDFGPELRATVSAMLRRMYLGNGVGLAAPQVGIDARIIVANSYGDHESDLVLVNPTILDRSGSTTVRKEGCLSFPGFYAEVPRPDRCRVRAQHLSGATFEAEYEGFLSRIVQHEYDHLEGVLFVDRMSHADRRRFREVGGHLVPDPVESTILERAQAKRARKAARRAAQP